MASLSGTENPAVAAAYDFSKVQRIVDVGGSMGHLLATILRANPRLRESSTISRGSWPPQKRTFT